MNHFPKNLKHCTDQFADPSRISSTDFKREYERIFGPPRRKGGLTEQQLAQKESRHGPEEHSLPRSARAEFGASSSDASGTGEVHGSDPGA